MTNREWLNNMATIDKLLILLKHTDGCPLYLLGKHYTASRCDKYSKSDDPKMLGTCYNCMCHWLNEEAM